MTIILACVAYTLVGGIAITTLPAVSTGYLYDEPKKSSAVQSCAAHRTVEHAALSALKRDELDDTLQLYRVDLETLQVTAVPRPTARIVIEEKP